ncbi:hypothetical protein VNO80_04735 [Phaseolus coccineus]|uniref:Uncharacterized protein n=1 Tax=Phaseolus coccineus TaxID=3886 RepID=A0AAN9RNY0_PHACN
MISKCPSQERVKSETKSQNRICHVVGDTLRHDYAVSLLSLFQATHDFAVVPRLPLSLSLSSMETPT